MPSLVAELACSNLRATQSICSSTAAKLQCGFLKPFRRAERPFFGWPLWFWLCPSALLEIALYPNGVAPKRSSLASMLAVKQTNAALESIGRPWKASSGTSSKSSSSAARFRPEPSYGTSSCIPKFEPIFSELHHIVSWLILASCWFRQPVLSVLISGSRRNGYTTNRSGNAYATNRSSITFFPHPVYGGLSVWAGWSST